MPFTEYCLHLIFYLNVMNGNDSLDNVNFIEISEKVTDNLNLYEKLDSTKRILSG